MMTMLQLRWAASRLLCLSGAAGHASLRPADDEDSDSDGYDCHGCDRRYETGRRRASSWPRRDGDDDDDYDVT